MEWENTNRALERILLFGTYGVGKTKAAFDIAEKAKGKVWYIETDNTLDEFLDAYVGVEVEEYRPRGWGAVMDAMEDVWEKCERDDWVVVDNATNVWGWVQDWYTEKMYGANIGEFLMGIRTKQLANDRGNATSMEGLFHDWTTINTQYNRFRGYLLNNKCNLLVTADVKFLDGKEKDKLTVTQYGHLGVKPDAQKRLGADVRTVIWLARNAFGEYTMTTAKDRAREDMTQVPWDNFFKGYLAKNGWMPSRKNEE